MARNYAALPHEYLEEMEALSDAEFGRLCRALLRYSMTGEEAQLSGAERLMWKRVRSQEQRYQKSYEELSKARQEAGRKGAEKRWRGTDGKATISHSKNSKTETETKTKTDSLPADAGKGRRAQAPERRFCANIFAQMLEEEGGAP